MCIIDMSLHLFFLTCAYMLSSELFVLFFYLGVLQQENIVYALILLHIVNFQELNIGVWI